MLSLPIYKDAEISVHFDHSYYFTYKTLGWAFSMFKMFKNFFVKRVSPDTWLVPLKICKLKMGRAPKSIPSWFGRVVVRIHSDLHFFYFSCVLVPLKSHKLRNNNHKIRKKLFFFFFFLHAATVNWYSCAWRFIVIFMK